MISPRILGRLGHRAAAAVHQLLQPLVEIFSQHCGHSRRSLSKKLSLALGYPLHVLDRSPEIPGLEAKGLKIAPNRTDIPSRSISKPGFRDSDELFHAVTPLSSTTCSILDRASAATMGANSLSSMDKTSTPRFPVKRIVLARELNINQIAAIASALKGRVEVECFVHGAMCISYSGRCLLSNYLAGRDANHGECVQACRWRYFIREQSREDELEVEEDERGTYFLNSKDLCMIRHLKALQDAGVASLKIEGRMKSSYYVACTTNAYRKAIDMLPKQAGEEFVRELEKTSHRRFTTGFYFGEQDKEFRESSTPVQTHEFVGVVQSCENGIATIEQRNFLQEGDQVEVLSPFDEVFNKTFKILNMKNMDGESIQKANVARMLFTCCCPLKLNEGDILRRKI